MANNIKTNHINCVGPVWDWKQDKFVEHRCPWWLLSSMKGKICKSYSLSPPHSRDMWCHWDVSNPKMNLLSHFGYLNTIQTLNTGLNGSGMDLHTDRYSDIQATNPNKHKKPAADLWGQGHELQWIHKLRKSNTNTLTIKQTNVWWLFTVMHLKSATISVIILN